MYGDISHQELVCLKRGIAEFLAVFLLINDDKLRVFGGPCFQTTWQA